MPRVCKACGIEKPASRKFYKSSTNITCIQCVALREKKKEQIAPAGMKFCTKCDKCMPLNNQFFVPRKGISGSFHARCRECKQAAEREYYSDDRRKLKKSQSASTSSRRESHRERSRIRYASLTLEQKRERVEKRKNSPNYKSHIKKQVEQRKADPNHKIKQSQYQKANREQGLERCRKFRAKKLATDPLFRDKASEYARKWRAKNPGASRAQNAKSKAKRLQAPGEFNNKDVNELFRRQNAKCFYCECKISRGVSWHVDHFIPLAKGGSNFPENLVLSCAFCNLSKSARLPWEFMPDKFSPPDQQAAD